MSRRPGSAFGVMLLIGLVTILVGCGGGGGGSDCSSNGNIQLQDEIGNILTSMTFNATQGDPAPADQTVRVWHNMQVDNIAAVLGRYPPSLPDPRDFGVAISPTGLVTDLITNPYPFTISISDTSLSPGTYNVVWRFVVVDASGNVLGCQDLPVRYNLQQITSPI